MARQAADQKGFLMNEYAVIQEIARKPGQTQREISRGAGLSLGMTNILLMRLARKGYIKIRQLDWKRTEYLLTLKGVLEKTRKSYAYTLHTIQLFHQITDAVCSAVQREYEAGTRQAAVVAWPETGRAIEGALRDMRLPDFKLDYVETFKKLGARPGAVFVATVEPAPKPAPEQRFITLLDLSDLRFKYPE